tara:strand:+ start:107 stop:295 length:189 start_codon:yes stop_codon:yes gene_type:complete
VTPYIHIKELQKILDQEKARYAEMKKGHHTQRVGQIGENAILRIRKAIVEHVKSKNEDSGWW